MMFEYCLVLGFVVPIIIPIIIPITCITFVLLHLAAVGLDIAMPLSEAPWAWLVYGPTSSLGHINYYHIWTEFLK